MVDALDLGERCAAILVLAEGALVEIDVALEDRQAKHWELDVIDVPWFAAYLDVGSGNELLDNEHRLTVTGQHASVWNHGPGNAALLVTVARGTTPTAAEPEDDGATVRPEEHPTSGATRLARSLRRLGRR